MPELREHGDEERVRQEDSRQDTERRADAELRNEVEAEEGEAGDGDRDRQAREDRRSASGRTGLRRGVARRQPFVEQLPKARDYQERVVDADAEPDHRDEQRRNRVDVGEAREDEEEQECRHQGDECERDGHHSRDEGAEHDQEHDQRGEQAENLLDSLLDRRELGVAVVLDGDPCGLDRLANGLLHGLDPRAILRIDHAVELRLRVRDPAVVGERVLVEGIADAGDAGVPVRRLAGWGELVGLEFRDRLLDRCAALGSVEALARRRREDEVQDTALFLDELRLDEVGRPLRVGAGNRELVLQAAADGGDEEDEPGDDAEPREHDPPRVRRARPHPARQRSGREALVRQSSFLLFHHRSYPL